MNEGKFKVGQKVRVVGINKFAMLLGTPSIEPKVGMIGIIGGNFEADGADYLVDFGEGFTGHDGSGKEDSGTSWHVMEKYLEEINE